MKSTTFKELITAQKQGATRGITSICSANLPVLNASFAHAQANDYPLLIESTCNQVNQFGGYTGQTPADFMGTLKQLAAEHRFPLDRLVAGGDHLGPNPWRHEAAAQAMDKSRRLVAEYVMAGYTKIHLDASMKCADDERTMPLSTEVIAARSAELALVAEESYRSLKETAAAPQYVIGSEVPTPGGAMEAEEVLSVTKVTDVAETIEETRKAFVDRGLEPAWERVIAVVVQPGVEFGSDVVFPYQSRHAQGLVKFIEGFDDLVYEAHSTDYQTPEALSALVKDHFAILKVGPALTFALREAVYGLAMIEDELLRGQAWQEPSGIIEVIEAEMLANPAHWQAHYHGTSAEQAIARRYSYSDRIRYYWPVPALQAALKRLLDNLSMKPIPLPLLSQYLPHQYTAIRSNGLESDPRMLIEFGVTAVLDQYAHACGLMG